MLSRSLTGQVLETLHCPVTRPDLPTLNRLLAAYVRTVPWESASRIAKRRRTGRLADCPRWPDEFWAAVVEQGCGGTCFESNYAFLASLRSLGYTSIHRKVLNSGVPTGRIQAIVLRPSGTPEFSRKTPHPVLRPSGTPEFWLVIVPPAPPP